MISPSVGDVCITGNELRDLIAGDFPRVFAALDVEYSIADAKWLRWKTGNCEYAAVDKVRRQFLGTRNYGGVERLSGLIIVKVSSGSTSNTRNIDRERRLRDDVRRQRPHVILRDVG